MNEYKILDYVPTVIENSSRGEKAFDIFSRLLRERIIFLGSEIDDDVANSIVAQLLYWIRKTPIKILCSILIPLAALLRQAWQFMTQ